MHRVAKLWAAVTAIVMVAAGLTGLGAVTAPAVAASGSDFNAGMIISDEVFYDSSTMSVGDIQAFLNARVPSCRSGYTCLKDYAQSTASQSAKSEGCAAYPGGWQSAAEIIWRVANVCGINPRALIVLLEKEQSLITDTWPSSRQYRSATGYGCPDTSDCDTNYYGFFNQVYHAAWQFKKYQARPDRAYRAGRNNTIQWHPNASCGSSQVFIENQATAGLYLYTPYRPNQAALDNLYGVGDSCSAYGNRNFWRIFTDWFGSTGYTVKGAFAEFYRANGGPEGFLGAPTSNEMVVDGGWKQRFSGGTLFTRVGTPVFAVRGLMRDYYRGVGEQADGLGWPVEQQVSLGNGNWYQAFERGRILVTGSTVKAVRGEIAKKYLSVGAQQGRLGFPTGDEAWGSGGWLQRFQGGVIASSTAGTFVITGTIQKRFDAAGGAAGGLGWPTEDERSVGSDWSQKFTSGAIVVRKSVDRVVKGDLGAYYVRASAEASALGWPSSNEARLGTGWTQSFEQGILYSSSVGTRAVPNALGPQYQAAGGPTGSLGWPTSDAVTKDARVSQSFQNGQLSTNPDVAVAGAVYREYARVGGASSALGMPTEAEAKVTGGVRQRFVGGIVYVTSARAFVVQGDLGRGYLAAGDVASKFGVPTSQERQSGIGWAQTFSSGVLYSSPAGVYAVMGAIRGYHDANGGVQGRLGWPSGAETKVDGGWRQSFTGGTVYAKDGRAPIVVWGDIGTYYAGAGEQAGAAGWPVSAERARPGGWIQEFDNGTVHNSPAGTALVGGDILRAYAAAGGSDSQVKWPVSDATVVGGGFSQVFVGGSYYARGGRVFVVQGAIATAYAGDGGAGGSLGWPTGNEWWSGREWRQDFERGSIIVDSAGARIVRR